MALMTCPDCATEISTEAPVCPKCGRPNAPPKKKTSPLAAGCALILVIGAAIGIFGAIFGSNNDDSTGSSSSTPAAADAKPYITTAQALYAAYARNEVATQDAIGDSPVQVTGVITSIDEDISGSPVLHLEDGDEFSQVGLTLADSEHDKAASLQKGVRVVVICHKMERIVDSPQGSDCYLPPIGN
jgi:tRNA_anti-like